MLDSNAIHLLNDTEAKIYRYVIDHIDDIYEMGVRELANDTFTSTATVIRMYKKLGCVSFDDFRHEMIAFFQNEFFSQEKEYQRLREDIAAVTSDEFQASIMRGTDAIQASRAVLIFGTGKDKAIAAYGARYLANVGYFAQAVEDLNYPPMLNAAEDDLIIAVSESGETKTLLDQLAFYKHKNVKVMLITTAPHSAIAKMADVVITYTAHPYILPQTYSLTSSIGAVYIFERLGRELYKRDKNILKTPPRF